MAATIAHEVNNPLEAVMNLIFLTRSNAENPEQVLRADTDLVQTILRSYKILEQHCSEAIADVGRRIRDLRGPTRADRG